MAKELSPEKVDQIRQGISDGKSDYQISKEVGVSDLTVKRYRGLITSGKVEQLIKKKEAQEVQDSLKVIPPDVVSYSVYRMNLRGQLEYLASYSRNDIQHIKSGEEFEAFIKASFGGGEYSVKHHFPDRDPMRTVYHIAGRPKEPDEEVTKESGIDIKPILREMSERDKRYQDQLIVEHKDREDLRKELHQERTKMHEENLKRTEEGRSANAVILAEAIKQAGTTINAFITAKQGGEDKEGSIMKVLIEMKRADREFLEAQEKNKSEMWKLIIGVVTPLAPQLFDKAFGKDETIKEIKASIKEVTDRFEKRKEDDPLKRIINDALLKVVANPIGTLRSARKELGGLAEVKTDLPGNRPWIADLFISLIDKIPDTAVHVSNIIRQGMIEKEFVRKTGKFPHQLLPGRSEPEVEEVIRDITDEMNHMRAKYINAASQGVADKELADIVLADIDEKSKDESWASMLDSAFGDTDRLRAFLRNLLMGHPNIDKVVSIVEREIAKAVQGNI